MSMESQTPFARIVLHLFLISRHVHFPFKYIHKSIKGIVERNPNPNK